MLLRKQQHIALGNGHLSWNALCLSAASSSFCLASFQLSSPQTNADDFPLLFAFIPGSSAMKRERVIIELLKNMSTDQVWPVLVWIKRDFLGSIPELSAQQQQSSSTFYTAGSWFRVLQKWELMALEFNLELRWVSAAEVFPKALGREVVHWSLAPALSSLMNMWGVPFALLVS